MIQKQVEQHPADSSQDHSYRSNPRSTRSPKKKNKGRPPIHQEPWSKVSLVLLERQVQFVDYIAYEIGESTDTYISRAAIVRAFLDVLLDLNVELEVVETEADLKELIKSKLLCEYLGD